MAYHHGQLRRALMDAALDLVKEAGPRGVTLRGAARRAEVSPSAPYRHFADKESLLAAVAAEGFTELADQLDRVGDAVSDPIERILRLGVTYVLFATENRAHYRVMFGEAVPERGKHPSLDGAARRTFGCLERAVAEAHARGQVRDEPGAVTLLAWSVVHGFSSLVLDGQARLPDERRAVQAVAEHLGRLLLDGVRAGVPA